MPWFKVDDAFHSHPKVLATESAALGLWVVAGSWSSAHLTGGSVPDDILPRLLPDAVKLAESLVATGLWKRTRRGYKFNDWGVYNPSAGEAKRLRDVRAKAGQKGGLASGKARSKREANASASASGLVEPPSRPDPTRKNPPHAARAGHPRAQRIPPDFAVTDDMAAWAAVKAPGVNIRAETEHFVDYWRARPGREACKLDWPATWRNWIRRTAQEQPPHSRSRQQETDELFDRAMERARAREEASDPTRNGHPDPLRQSTLPSADD